MPQINRQYLLNSDGRIFIRQKSGCCPLPYEFYNCMRLDGLQKSFGEPTPQFCPSPEKRGEFIEIATIEAAESRLTSGMVGRIPLSYDSIMYKLAEAGCEFDIQVHFGLCADLTKFTEFESAIVLENVNITSYSTDQLGALTPDENTIVNENVAISAGEWYAIRKLKFTDIGSNGPLSDTTTQSYFTSLTCPPDGCKDCCTGDCIIFVLVGNYALNRQEIWASTDYGATWTGPVVIPSSGFMAGFTHESLTNTSALYCDGEDIYISSTISGPDGIIWRAKKSDILNNVANFTVVFQNSLLLPFTTGYASLTKFKDKFFAIRQRIIGAAEAATVSVLNLNLDGTNTFTSVYDPNIHAASDRPDRTEWGLINYNNEVMLVGVESMYTVAVNQAYFAYSYDGITWIEVRMTYNGQPVLARRTRPIPLSINTWLVYVSDGTNVTPRLYCTTDAGQTFNLINPNTDRFITKVFNNNIAYGITESTTLQNKFIRTYDLGINTKIMPEDGITQLPTLNSSIANGDINFCKNDPNFVIMGHPGNSTPLTYTTGSLWRVN